MAEKEKTEGFGPIGDQLRQFDKDRFAMALLAPEKDRAVLFALYAFTLELARARETVSEAHLGLFRLQFLKDAVTAYQEKGQDRPPSGHASLEALFEVMEEGRGPSLETVHQLIEGRVRDMDDTPFASLAELEGYAEATAGRLAEAAGESLGLSKEACETLRESGTAYGLIGLARAVPFWAGQKRCLLPEDLMRASAASKSDLQTGQAPKELGMIIAALLNRAQERLDANSSPAKALWKENSASRAILLHRVSAKAYLKALRGMACDPFDPKARLLRPPVGRLFWTAKTGFGL